VSLKKPDGFAPASVGKEACRPWLSIAAECGWPARESDDLDANAVQPPIRRLSSRDASPVHLIVYTTRQPGFRGATPIRGQSNRRHLSHSQLSGSEADCVCSAILGAQYARQIRLMMPVKRCCSTQPCQRDLIGSTAVSRLARKPVQGSASWLKRHDPAHSNQTTLTRRSQKRSGDPRRPPSRHRAKSRRQRTRLFSITLTEYRPDMECILLVCLHPLATLFLTG
jgi:hypothetical protein